MQIKEDGKDVSECFSPALAASVVKAMYRVLLSREPDATGLHAYTTQLTRDPEFFTEMVRRFIASEEFQIAEHRARQLSVASLAHRFTNDKSQFGEIEFLLKLWVNGGATHRIVVDVGARGAERSNSFDLLRTFEWQGFLIEANPALISAIRKDFAGLDVEIIHCAISDYNGTARFHLGINDDVSSLDAAATLTWGAITGTIEVPVRRLGDLLEERGVPKDFDLLSIDIEGEDIKVINDLVVRGGYSPQWVIIEASYNFKTQSLSDLPLEQAVRDKYEIAAQTAANLILRLVSP